MGLPQPSSLFGAAALAASATLWPAASAAYCRTSACPGDVPGELCAPATAEDCGTPLYWPQPCFGFSVQRDASTQIPWQTTDDIVRQAFDTWLAADCGAGQGPAMRVDDLGPVTCAAREYNQDGGNANLIVFRDDAWPYAGQWSTLALTTVTYNLDTGEIYDADMELNSANVHLTVSDTDVEFDLRSIVTHEAGHMLGLAHSAEEAATMGRQYLPGEITLRDLTADDVAGICAAYAPAEPGSPRDPTRCDSTPRRGFQDFCGAAPVDEGCTLHAPAAGGRLALAGLGAGIGWLVHRRCRRRRAA